MAHHGKPEIFNTDRQGLQFTGSCRLAMTPLRFANPRQPSGWIEDFHLQAADHARHTEKSPGDGSGILRRDAKGIGRPKAARHPPGFRRGLFG